MLYELYFDSIGPLLKTCVYGVTTPRANLLMMKYEKLGTIDEEMDLNVVLEFVLFEVNVLLL